MGRVKYPPNFLGPTHIQGSLDVEGPTSLEKLITPYTKTVTIAPSGGDYTSIQAALDENNDDGELFLVYPGTYIDDTINYTADNQTIKGMGLTPDAVITNTGQICDYGSHTGCRMNNIRLEGTYDSAIDMITGSGSLMARHCHLKVDASGTISGSPRAVYTEGVFKQTWGTLEYNNDASSSGIIKRAVEVGSGGDMTLVRVTVDVDNSGDASATTPGYAVGTGVMDAYRCSVQVTDVDATMVVGLADIQGGGDQKYIQNEIYVTCGSSGKTGYGIYASPTNATTIRTIYNHLDVEDEGGTSYSTYLGSNATIISHFDDIVAADGYNDAGGTLKEVTSPHDGVLKISDLLNLMGEVERNRGSLKTSNYTTTEGDHLIPVDTSGGVVTITLGSAQVNDGLELYIKDEGGSAGTNNITIDTEGSETIDEASSISLTVDYDKIRLYSDGNNWFTI